MNQLQIFKNEQFGQVRTLIINNEPYLVGKDAAEILGYVDTDQALRNHVDGEDKLTRKINGLGQSRNVIVINESGLYSLIFGSKLPQSKEFKRWVTKEVLPTIRKTGSYNAKPITKEYVLEIINKLPNDDLKNEVAKMIIDRFLPTKKYTADIKPLLDGFMQNDGVIVKETENGIAIDAPKFFDFFNEQGVNKREILNKLDEAELIYHPSHCRTVQIRIGNGNRVRVLIVK